jgi:hypothetical protein
VEERGTRVARRLKAARGGAAVRGGKHCRSRTAAITFHKN